MRQKLIESLAYLFSGLSIAAYALLLSASNVRLLLSVRVATAGALFAFGLALASASALSLVRHRGAGLIDWGVYGLVRLIAHWRAMAARRGEAVSP